MEQAMQQRRRRRAFTATYKAEVVELCRKGERSIAQVARDLGLTETSVRRWVEQAEVDAGRRPGLTSSEHEELVQLRKEVRVLREERDILKRATAFFARETR
jgi:transposase